MSKTVYLKIRQLTKQTSRMCICLMWQKCMLEKKAAS